MTIGLTPKDHSTAGKVRLGVITRAGDEALRSVLVCGATSILRQIRDGRGKNVSPWLIQLLKRKPPKLATVALANEIARIAWKLMISGETKERLCRRQSWRAPHRDRPDTGSIYCCRAEPVPEFLDG